MTPAIRNAADFLRPALVTTMIMLLLGSAALTSSVYAIVGRHDREDKALLELGARFPATGKIGEIGTCTLIAPTWVVTAGHVAFDVKPGAVSVHFGKEPYGIKRVVMHPDCKPTRNRPPEVDLALVELTKPVRGISPVSLNRSQNEKDKAIFVAGYGDVGNGSIRPRKSDGKLRAATNVIDQVAPKLILFDFAKPPAGTEMEGVSGPGDSGGPAYVVDGTNQVIVGVSSAAMDGRPGRYGVTEVYTRISAFVKWIDSVIK